MKKLMRQNKRGESFWREYGCRKEKQIFESYSRFHQLLIQKTLDYEQEED